MNVTIVDIAKAAGVSPSTVSRVISGNPRISSATIHKVKETMNQLGYYQNVMAKSLVSKTTQTIGLLLPRSAEELFRNMFFPELIRGITSQANRSGYDVMMAAGATDQEELESVTRLVRGGRVDGVILLYSRKSDPVISFLKQLQFPFVLIGRSEEHPDIISVDNDNIQAAYDTTEHLITHGNERIGLVSGPLHHIVSHDRLQGYRLAMEKYGLKARPEWIFDGELLHKNGRNMMSLYMCLPERPTALVVMDDTMAFSVLRTLTELQYSVPKDVRIVSFNNIPLTELATPPISSVDINIYQLGYMAAQNLLQSVKGKPVSQVRTIIPHHLIPRESSIGKGS